MKKPREIVQEMLEGDAFSKHLGMQLREILLGSCSLQMVVNQEMVNGFGIAHGGITYSFADSALAFASNSHGFHCVSIETSISHVRPVHAGDTLTATAVEKHRGRTIGIYEVTISNQQNKNVALFKGIVNISTKMW
jgi:acyl-CoA thioesterase